MTDDVRAVIASLSHVVGLHCALPSIATLSAASRVLRRVILSEMKAVRRFFSIHKTVFSSASRCTQKYCAPQSGKNNSDRVPKNKIRTKLVRVAIRTWVSLYISSLIENLRPLLSVNSVPAVSKPVSDFSWPHTPNPWGHVELVQKTWVLGSGNWVRLRVSEVGVG